MSPTTSNAGHLQGTSAREHSKACTAEITAMADITIRTYVSVLTVSSFRPTTGLSIPRSRRLVQGEKQGTQLIPASHARQQHSQTRLVANASENSEAQSYYW